MDTISQAINRDHRRYLGAAATDPASQLGMKGSAQHRTARQRPLSRR